MSSHYGCAWGTTVADLAIAERTFATQVSEVYVCENPAVVAAAANALGALSRPLICTNGRPSCATRRLIAGLASAGVTMWIRADDDHVGQQIVEEVADLAQQCYSATRAR